jgi:endoglucanase
MIRLTAALRRALAAAATAVLACAPAHAAGVRPLDPQVQVRSLGRGVNILGYDPLWEARGEPRFNARHFRLIRQGGFRTVRVNLQAFGHMNAQDRLDPRWLKTLDWVVREATRAHLNVILDEHDYNPCSDQPQACGPRLLAFWRQVGARYRTAPASVMFELLNEPHKGLDASWNGLLREALATVRATNPRRNVIVGPADWNDIDSLSKLDLPKADRHLIVTIHYYRPMAFTHQGAAWNPATPRTGVSWGSPQDEAKVGKDFDAAQAWAQANRRPIFLGEFGAYDKAPMDARVRYTAAVARAAEARGWPWAYWQFEGDFGVWDMAADRWVEPLHRALVPDR